MRHIFGCRSGVVLVRARTTPRYVATSHALFVALAAAALTAVAPGTIAQSHIKTTQIDPAERATCTAVRGLLIDFANKVRKDDEICSMRPLASIESGHSVSALNWTPIAFSDSEMLHAKMFLRGWLEPVARRLNQNYDDYWAGKGFAAFYTAAQPPNVAWLEAHIDLNNDGKLEHVVRLDNTSCRDHSNSEPDTLMYPKIAALVDGESSIVNQRLQLSSAYSSDDIFEFRGFTYDLNLTLKSKNFAKGIPSNDYNANFEVRSLRAIDDSSIPDRSAITISAPVCTFILTR